VTPEISKSGLLIEWVYTKCYMGLIDYTVSNSSELNVGPNLNFFFVGEQNFSYSYIFKKEHFLLFQNKVHNLLERFFLISMNILNIVFVMHPFQMILKKFFVAHFIITLFTVEGRIVPMLETVIPQGGLLGKCFLAKLALEADFHMVGLSEND
jgi:hypothetical protein